MFLTLPPAPQLAPYVHAYWFIEDIPGDYEGSPIRTSPLPVAVLSVNIGRPNASDDGALVPGTALLGLQTRSRLWRSWSDTYFVMAMLTVPGLIRLFPHSGSGSSDRLLELGAVTGDTNAGALCDGVTAALDPIPVAGELDRWLLARLAGSEPIVEGRRLVSAHRILRRGGSVTKAARAAGTNRRQLQRWCHRHLGVGPKTLADLERLQRSLRSVQTTQGDPVTGFSDQAHQIRTWRRRLGITPGAYRADTRSSLAAYFSANTTPAEPIFYL